LLGIRYLLRRPKYHQFWTTQKGADHRYLAVGTTAGLSGDDADVRFAQLQKEAADQRIPKISNKAAVPAADGPEDAAEVPIMDEYTPEDELAAG